MSSLSIRTGRRPADPPTFETPGPLAKPQKTHPASQEPAAAAKLADAALAAGRFRDAIAAYKTLFKRFPADPEWPSGLATAYVGRAQELTTKGMLKEALAIWENRAALAVAPVAHPEHAALLLRLDRIPDLFALIRRAPAAEQPGLRGLVAARLLVDDALLTHIPADDPLCRHLAEARAALAAWCDGADDQVRAALAAIPFRSPYRDWAQVLKALLRQATEPAEAAALLARVPADSPFATLARAAALATLPEERLAPALATAGPNTLRFALGLRGWPEPRIDLFEEWRALPDSGPQSLLRLLHRHRNSLGAAWVRARTLRLLVAGWPGSARWLQAVGAPALTPPERSLILAWRAEQNGDLDRIDAAWQQHHDDLAAAGAEFPDHRLRLALGLRRVDQIGNVLARHTASRDPAAFDRQVADQVERSLQEDPDDQVTCLRLLDYYHRGGLHAPARRLLDHALARWPRVLPVLLAALDQALAAGAFKRASGLARQILELDPINNRVRERLVDAHLAHARTQIAAGRLDLARKELALAGDWAQGAQAGEHIALTDGILQWVAAGDGAALAATALRIGPLAGRVSLTCALAGCRLNLKGAFARLKLPALDGSDPADLREALARLRAELDRSAAASKGLGRDLTEALTGTFRKVNWAGLDPSELVSACETLRRARLAKAREAAAKAGLLRRPGEPVLQLHWFEARYGERERSPPYHHVLAMMKAFRDAVEAGDERTARRIQQVMADFGYGPDPFIPTPGPAWGDEDDDPALADRQLPLPGLEAASSGDFSEEAQRLALRSLLRTLGLKGTLDLFDLPPAAQREIERLGRREGDEAVVELFLYLLAEGGQGPAESPPTRRRR